MNVSQASKIWLDYHRTHSKENTTRDYKFTITKFNQNIFRTNNVRNCLILKLKARGGMRVGEVLKLTPNDILDRKLILKDIKSGKEQELIFIPQKVADRLKESVRVQKIAPKRMIFPIC